VRRLHKESQPLEQLDMIIEEIRRLMIRSAEAVSKGKLSRGEPAIAAGQQMQQQQRSDGAGWTAPKNCLGSRWISTTMLGSS
jgi:hypothetical protein